MWTTISWFEPLAHGAAGPFDEIVMVVAFLGGWGALIYFLLKDRGQHDEDEETPQEELKDARR
jgi:hypothetical protein